MGHPSWWNEDSCKKYCYQRGIDYTEEWLKAGPEAVDRESNRRIFTQLAKDNRKSKGDFVWNAFIVLAFLFIVLKASGSKG